MGIIIYWIVLAVVLEMIRVGFDKIMDRYFD